MTTLPCILQTRQPENVLPIALALLPFSPELPEITEPPLANRGLIPQSPTSELIPTIDYITGIVRDVPWEDVLYLKTEIEDAGKTSFVDKPGVGTKHGTYFSSHMKCPLGSKIAYQANKLHPENFDAIFVVAGKVCGRMGTSRAGGLIRAIDILGGHLSRIDPKADDYLRDLNYEDLLPLVDAGKYTTFQSVTQIKNTDSNGQQKGFTFNFGSRTGDRCVRIYDAKPVHGIEATRFEAEFKGENAKAIGKMIAKCEDDESLTRLLGGLLNGIFRFTVTNDNHNASRVRSAPCWERFSSRLASAKRVARERVTVCLQSKIAWLRDKCSKSLAMFKAYYGVHFEGEFDVLIRAGFARLNGEDLSLLGASSREGLTRIWCENSTILDLPHNPDWFREWMNQDVLESEGYDTPF